jgi:membrane associated rhomboid family serine protease
MIAGIGPITLLILAVTIFVSYRAMNDLDLKSKLLFNPYAFKHGKQYGRIITHGLVHGSWLHLGINMFVLWSFGSSLEQIFVHGNAYAGYSGSFEGFGTLGHLAYLGLYTGGLIFATLPSVKKHGDSPNYNSLGASGAISAVILSFIIFNPMAELRLMFAIPIRAWLAAVLLFVYESYMDKRGKGNIAHDAHLWGAFFGVLFMILIDFDLLVECIRAIRNSIF